MGEVREEEWGEAEWVSVCDLVGGRGRAVLLGGGRREFVPSRSWGFYLRGCCGKHDLNCSARVIFYIRRMLVQRL